MVTLLGKPSHEGTPGDWDLVYWLGPEEAIYEYRLGMAGLCGSDPDDKVVGCRIVRN